MARRRTGGPKGRDAGREDRRSQRRRGREGGPEAIKKGMQGGRTGGPKGREGGREDRRTQEGRERGPEDPVGVPVDVVAYKSWNMTPERGPRMLVFVFLDLPGVAYCHLLAYWFSGLAQYSIVQYSIK